MATNIFFRTLNSIRSAMKPAGRDVAEAFDAVDTAVGDLKAQIAAIKPTTAVTNNTTQVTNKQTINSSGASQPYVPPSTPSVAKVTGSYTTSSTDVGVEVTATTPCTISLSSNLVGRSVYVKNYSASGVVITIQDANGGTIDNAASIQEEWQNTSGTFVYDGSNWAIT